MSDASPESGAPQPVLARNCTVDAVVVVQARALGAGWTSDGPGSGYFPFYIGLILCIASAGILYQAVVSKKRDTRAFESIFDTIDGIGPARRRAILQHFGSADRFLEASQEELEAVPGLPAKTARAVYGQLHKTAGPAS